MDASNAMKLVQCAMDQEQHVFVVQIIICKTMMDRALNAAKVVEHVLDQSIHALLVKMDFIFQETNVQNVIQNA